MKSATHKVLHPIGGRPMLCHLLAELDALAPARTVVVVGDRADQVEAALAGGRAEVAIQEPQLGTGHAVQQAHAALAGFAGVILILFGDVPLLTAATMQRLVARITDPPGAALAVLGFRPADPGAYGRIIADRHGQIERMVEARDATADELAVGLCNSGLMAVRSDRLFGWLARVGNANAAGEYYLPDIVMLARGEGASAVVIEGDADELVGINSRAELAAAEAIFQQRRRAALMAEGVTLLAPETVFVAHDTRIGRDTVVGPFATFGPGVVIGEAATIHAHCHLEGAVVGDGAQVGPYARLRPGTVLGRCARVGNFVETKQAVLGAGAKVSHLSYVGDATVGAGANIGAGTITCNYDGFHKHHTEIGDGAFIGSNSALVAPVSIGAGAVVGAGATITRAVPADALALARADQVVRPGWAARFRAAMLSRKDRG